jgi:hypothetical protein
MMRLLSAPVSQHYRWNTIKVSVCVKDGAFILRLFKSSFYTVKQYRIIAYGAFLQSRRFVIRRFVIRRFVIRRFVIRRFDVSTFWRVDVWAFDVLSFDVLSFDVLSFNVLSYDVLSFDVLYVHHGHSRIFGSSLIMTLSIWSLSTWLPVLDTTDLYIRLITLSKWMTIPSIWL